MSDMKIESKILKVDEFLKDVIFTRFLIFKDHILGKMVIWMISSKILRILL